MTPSFGMDQSPFPDVKKLESGAMYSINVVSSNRHPRFGRSSLMRVVVIINAPS